MKESILWAREQIPCIKKNIFTDVQFLHRYRGCKICDIHNTSPKYKQQSIHSRLMILWHRVEARRVLAMVTFTSLLKHDTLMMRVVV